MTTLSLPREHDTPPLFALRVPRAPVAAATSAPRTRCGIRAFRSDPLTLQQAARLLAAAFASCPGSWGRTAPSAEQWQEITLYAVMPQGTYRHDPHTGALRQVSADDLRAATGAHDRVLRAPLHLVYVSDFGRVRQDHAEEHGLLAGADAGAIVEHIHLQCAHMGLGDLVRGSLERPALARALGLAPTQRITLVQTVGYPAPEALG